MPEASDSSNVLVFVSLTVIGLPYKLFPRWCHLAVTDYYDTGSHENLEEFVIYQIYQNYHTSVPPSLWPQQLPFLVCRPQCEFLQSGASQDFGLAVCPIVSIL